MTRLPGPRALLAALAVLAATALGPLSIGPGGDQRPTR